MSQALAAKQLFFSSDVDYSEYAVVNDSNACIVTDFMLGDYMTLDVCFKKIDSSATGLVLVGYESTVDYRDYRLFFANSQVFGDCGNGGRSYGVGARSIQVLSDTSSWHTTVFPTPSGSSDVMLVDGKAASTVEIAYTVGGNFGATASKLCVCSRRPAISQLLRKRPFAGSKSGNMEAMSFSSHAGLIQRAAA